MPETNVRLRYEPAGVAELNGERHRISEISTCQLQAGRAAGKGAPAADARPPVSVLVKG
jgi:hypothetical protein